MTAALYRLPRHHWHRCDGNAGECFCSLFPKERVCSVCYGVEGRSLPSDCPGTAMRYEMMCRVRDGLIDFKDGRWVCCVPSKATGPQTA